MKQQDPEIPNFADPSVLSKFVSSIFAEAVELRDRSQELTTKLVQFCSWARMQEIKQEITEKLKETL